MKQAQYYLKQTEMRAPNYGTIINLQVQEGMVSGVLRVGAIASLILNQDPYLIAAYRQENLMNVRVGQPVVVAINTYPGKHFTGKVEEIWEASKRGQYTPPGNLPLFPDIPLHTEARLPIKITLDDPTVRLGIGVGGATLILTSDSPFTWIGQISLRTYTWARRVYPLPL
ncbi:efflux RND transporter periplasmic adaptor subunit [Phaeobacter marinintestinus]|uniref:efflux RND transporter periplasmic adaptor subunit n=1 Tax=Falsiphaeobacter marinintestinus TaxID=1492905 RepID=UPI0011B36E69|nr:efflux RND transporter periplasmic adaptor subunit [Phaeobacter marinintestinus]